MITEMAIEELNKVLTEFRHQNAHTVLTCGEVLNIMTKEELIQLVAKLFVAANNVVQSRL